MNHLRAIDWLFGGIIPIALVIYGSGTVATWDTCTHLRKAVNIGILALMLGGMACYMLVATPWYEVGNSSSAVAALLAAVLG